MAAGLGSTVEDTDVVPVRRVDHAGITIPFDRKVKSSNLAERAQESARQSLNPDWLTRRMLGGYAL